MAKREKRKTSLGNVLDGNNAANKHDTLQPARSRSVSESSSQPLSRPRLFRSVREAMEFEATEAAEEERRGNAVVATARPLDARTLSTLEKTQADQAGYTVIRRRAISDPIDLQPPRGRAGGNRSGDSKEQRKDQRGKQPTRERRTDATSSASSKRGGAAGASSSWATRRQSKRSPTSTKSDSNNVWAPASSATSPDADPARDASDEQRWLAAASAGAVLPARIAPSTGVPPWPATASGPSTWSPTSSASRTVVSLKEPSVTSPSQVQLRIADETPSNAAALDESMLTWLENALALDTTTRVTSPHAINTSGSTALAACAMPNNTPQNPTTAGN